MKGTRIMQNCPECGSGEIVDGLLVFADQALYGNHPVHVGMIEPDPEHRPFIWSPKEVVAGFRVAVCGACGYSRFYTTHHAELLEAQRSGYHTQEYAAGIRIPPS
jgi:predicted nucleic-acid-binding Zn-ribbon protein